MKAWQLLTYNLLHKSTHFILFETYSPFQSSCSYYVYVSGREFPCSDVWSDGPSNQIYPCRGNSYSKQFINTVYTINIYPTSYSQRMMINMASDLYISVVRSEDNLYDACTYTISP